MSTFAQLVRDRVAAAATSGRLTNPHRDLSGQAGSRAIQSGLELVRRLAQSNVACASDKDCAEVAAVLQIAAQGTPADKRTALTRLQRLLTNLTAADSDVAADESIQDFRRNLHVALDH